MKICIETQRLASLLPPALMISLRHSEARLRLHIRLVHVGVLKETSLVMSLQRRICKVNILHAKPNTLSLVPLQIVYEAPSQCSSDVDTFAQ